MNSYCRADDERRHQKPVARIGGLTGEIGAQENPERSVIIRQTWKKSCGIIFLDKTERSGFNEKGMIGLEICAITWKTGSR